MVTDTAPVTPEILRWARESVGVSIAEAAKRAGVTEERVVAWEEGTQQPTLAKLRAIAKLYQRPISVFFLAEPPRAFDAMRDFRRLPGANSSDWSRPLHKAYRRAVEQQDIMLELLRLEGEEAESKIPAASISEAADTAAARGRAALDVSVAEQHHWSSPEVGVKAWVEALESLGVLVLRTSEVPADEMRGFSVSGDLAVVMVNALDPPRAQAFTLLHEFAHLMLRTEGLCDLIGPQHGENQVVESWCNAVAASIAMPRDGFVDELGPAARFQTEWDEAVIGQLSSRWSMSKEAVVRRLLTLEFASADFYSRKREEYREAYQAWRDQQREDRRKKKSSGGPPPYRMVVRDRGRPYVRLALDAYHQNLISTSSLTRVLALKAKHISQLEKEVP